MSPYVSHLCQETWVLKQSGWSGPLQTINIMHFFGYSLKEELAFLSPIPMKQIGVGTLSAMTKCSSLSYIRVYSISRSLQRNSLREGTGACTFQTVERSLPLSQVISFQNHRARLWNRDVFTFNLKNRMKERDLKGPSLLQRLES